MSIFCEENIRLLVLPWALAGLGNLNDPLNLGGMKLLKSLQANSLRSLPTRIPRAPILARESFCFMRFDECGT